MNEDQNSLYLEETQWQKRISIYNSESSAKVLTQNEQILNKKPTFDELDKATATITFSLTGKYLLLNSFERFIELLKKFKESYEYINHNKPQNLYFDLDFKFEELFKCDTQEKENNASFSEYDLKSEFQEFLTEINNIDPERQHSNLNNLLSRLQKFCKYSWTDEEKNKILNFYFLMSFYSLKDLILKLIDYDDYTLAVATAHSFGKKYSAHLIFKFKKNGINLIFANTFEVKKFILNNKIDKILGVDMQVYRDKGGGLFRNLYSYKNSENRPLIPELKLSYKFEKITDSLIMFVNNPTKFITQNCFFNDNIGENTINFSETKNLNKLNDRNANSNHVINHKIIKNFYLENPTTELEIDLYLLIIKLIGTPEKIISATVVKNKVNFLNIVYKGTCVYKKSQHKSNNSFLVLSETCCIYKCFDEICKKKLEEKTTFKDLKDIELITKILENENKIIKKSESPLKMLRNKNETFNSISQEEKINITKEFISEYDKGAVLEKIQENTIKLIGDTKNCTNKLIQFLNPEYLVHSIHKNSALHSFQFQNTEYSLLCDNFLNSKTCEILNKYFNNEPTITYNFTNFLSINSNNQEEIEHKIKGENCKYLIERISEKKYKKLKEVLIRSVETEFNNLTFAEIIFELLDTHSEYILDRNCCWCFDSNTKIWQPKNYDTTLAFIIKCNIKKIVDEIQENSYELADKDSEILENYLNFCCNRFLSNISKIIETFKHIVNKTKVLPQIDVFIRNCHVLAFQDCVYDFELKKFRDIVKEDFITEVIPFKIKNNTEEEIRQAEIADRFIEDLISSMFTTKEQSEFLKFAIYNSLNPLTQKYPLFFCLGDGGNGKTTIMELISKAFGYRTAKLPQNFFVSPRSSDPAKASEDVAHIKGKMVIIMSEPCHREIDSSKLKIITGSELLYYRKNFGSAEEFAFGGTTFINANYMPKISGPIDNSMMRRSNIIVFPVTFKELPLLENEKPLNPSIYVELKKEENVKAFARVIMKSSTEGNYPKEWKEELLKLKKLNKVNFELWLSENIVLHTQQRDDVIDFKEIYRKYYGTDENNHHKLRNSEYISLLNESKKWFEKNNYKFKNSIKREGMGVKRGWVGVRFKVDLNN